MVCIDPLTPEVAMLQRRHLNAYLNVPVYKEFHRWLGREPLLSAMWTAWDSGDRKAALAAVPDVVVQDLFVAGTAEERNAHVQRYLEAGVDTAFLQFISFEPDPAVRRERVLQAMREMSPKAAGM
jgi:alkanesulfonate monooxygenase SsuD/methylene tetrahydromethanopterin reductase-like flavin-dependent oxidoreductase (luciferase family)